MNLTKMIWYKRKYFFSSNDIFFYCCPLMAALNSVIVITLGALQMINELVILLYKDDTVNLLGSVLRQ